MAKQKIDYLERILQKKYTALYLTKTKKILRTNNVKNMSIIRFTHFSDEPVYVCGIEHCVQFLKNIKEKIKVYGVKDETLVKPGDPILLIRGDYSAIAEYESVIDGIIARESSICNNTKQILKIIKTKQLIYMGDRADLYLTQPYDGYAAYVGGLRIFTTEAHADFINDKKIKIVGTIPHALIQQFNGNLSKAL
ncbi:MAG: hypothetical protein MJ223_02160 [Mycoplasmoidaceae bacterium]|nr:hypothetical protein [Mycoplasmoidaceae bacterium]